MNQSSTSVAINLRTKGLRNVSGILIKGCVKDATTKLSIGSIPSNYQTIIYHTQSTKAFGTSQKRFYHQAKVDLDKTNTSYSFTQSTEPSMPKNPSHSTKGYGPFIANEKRIWIQKKQAPGPGRYHDTMSAQHSFQKAKKRPYFPCEMKQNIKPVDCQSNQTPGPGKYDIFDRNSANKGCKSSFKTNLNRNTYLKAAKTPGPGYYDVKLIKQPKSIIKQPVGRQKSAKQWSVELLEVMDWAKKEQMPGPVSYNYDIPTFKPLYERIKISRNFIMSKKGRFNNQVQRLPGQVQVNEKPDIYSYNMKSDFQEERRLIKWPCFMSQSKRTVFGGKKRLGPSFVTTKLQNRKNYHFNIKGGWF